MPQFDLMTSLAGIINAALTIGDKIYATICSDIINRRGQHTQATTMANKMMLARISLIHPIVFENL